MVAWFPSVMNDQGKGTSCWRMVRWNWIFSFLEGCPRRFPLRRWCICFHQEPSSTNTGPLKLNFWLGFFEECHNSSINSGSNLCELRHVMMSSPGDFFFISILLKANTETGTYKYSSYVIGQPTFPPLFSK